MFRAAIKDVAGLTEALQAAGGGAGLVSYDQVEALPDYPATFPAAGHQHPISQVQLLQATIDDLQAQLDARPLPVIVENFADVGDTVPVPPAGTWIVELP